jgi:hypothetical protein
MYAARDIVQLLEAIRTSERRHWRTVDARSGGDEGELIRKRCAEQATPCPVGPWQF